MRRKKKNSLSYNLAFLDVLSNAMAAVLIIAMVKMKPSTRGQVERGVYSISVENMTEQQRANLGLGLKYKNEDYIFSDEKPDDTRFVMLTPTDGPAKIIFKGKPALSDIEEIMCFIIDPVPLQNIELEILIKLPQRYNRVEKPIISRINEYSFLIYPTTNL